MPKAFRYIGLAIAVIATAFCISLVWDCNKRSNVADAYKNIDSLNRQIARLEGENKILLQERAMLSSVRDSFAAMISEGISRLGVIRKTYYRPIITRVIDSSEAVLFLKTFARKELSR